MNYIYGVFLLAVAGNCMAMDKQAQREMVKVVLKWVQKDSGTIYDSHVNGSEAQSILKKIMGSGPTSPQLLSIKMARASKKKSHKNGTREKIRSKKYKEVGMPIKVALKKLNKFLEK